MASASSRSLSSSSSSAVVLPLLLLLLLGLLICIPSPSSARHFRRFFLFSTANPIAIQNGNDYSDQVEEVQIGREQQQRRIKAAEQEDEAVQPRLDKQRAQQGTGVRLSLKELWKRGGDFCGCNMGCFYHSVGQCASCCSLGLRR